MWAHGRLVAGSGGQVIALSGKAPRYTQRLRHALCEYFTAALDVRRPRHRRFPRAAWKGPDSAAAARLTHGQITAPLQSARRDTETKTDRIQATLRSKQLGGAAVITTAHAATVRSEVAGLTTLTPEIKALQG